MKYLSIFTFMLMWAFVVFTPVQAQQTLACGETIEDAIVSDRQTREYRVNLKTGDTLIFDVAVTRGNLGIDIGLTAPDGTQLKKTDYYSRGAFHQWNTGDVFAPGNYSILVSGWTDLGGSFRLTANCIGDDGTVIAGNTSVAFTQCGSSFENEFSATTRHHHYYLRLKRGDILRVDAQVRQGSFAMALDIGIYGNVSGEIDEHDYYDRDIARSKQTLGMPSDDLYEIYVPAYTDTGGQYTISIGCTPSGGNEIPGGSLEYVDLMQNPELASGNPAAGRGSANPQPTVTLPAGSNATPVPVSSCTGICFAGLPSKDLNNVAKLPLVAGAPMTAALTPTGSEIYGFALDAVSGQTLNLNISRLVGNLNVGVVLLTPDNQTAFATVMTSNTSLVTDLVLPQDGQYTVAVFRADGFLPPAAPEASAFTITGALN